MAIRGHQKVFGLIYFRFGNLFRPTTLITEYLPGILARRSETLATLRFIRSARRNARALSGDFSLLNKAYKALIRLLRQKSNTALRPQGARRIQSLRAFRRAESRSHSKIRGKNNNKKKGRRRRRSRRKIRSRRRRRRY